ncbi:Protein UPSTREAM OF FLC [Parasponia andersonii]|uniref:Protein UPSTREAM OF FLC n=1 Tax=Parasponia andersonii TaxID=3476 RepID=A0A2P5CDA8_PARAD|nr:Protein UPSTREAM OF FLC [Parasponia andersonii]
MAVSSRGQTKELQNHKRWKDREISPERNRVWTEPKLKTNTERKVPVVYYLSRNGQLEHPHFMEVPLSSPDGLFLRDVINRLNALRGKGMATMYSWSSKRSYRNGFVWHDLSENDFIYPAHGHEYVLKGSELQVDPAAYDPKVLETASSRSLRPPPEIQNSGGDSDFPAIVRRRNQSWSSIDLHEYKVYKAESIGESAGKAAADASTQTDDKRRRRRALREEGEKDEPEPELEKGQREMYEIQSTELSRDEISPPPSDSSPETLESLMKADGRLVIAGSGAIEEGVANRTSESCVRGRMKASSVLMQLISCGAVSFKDCGSNLVKDHGISLIGHYNKARLPRGAGNHPVGTPSERSNFSRVKLEDKEYFSGSLVETKKAEVPALQRSTSYNADRSSRLELAEEELGVRAKCIPRKSSKTLAAKKETSIITSCDNGNSSEGGNKRLDVHT